MFFFLWMDHRSHSCFFRIDHIEHWLFFGSHILLLMIKRCWLMLDYTLLMVSHKCSQFISCYNNTVQFSIVYKGLCHFFITLIFRYSNRVVWQCDSILINLCLTCDGNIIVCYMSKTYFYWFWSDDIILVWYYNS
jgi:hypothetical protein